MGTTTGARRNGKTNAMLQATRQATERGEHVHIARNTGMYCLNGPADCTVTRRTITQLERDLRR